MLAAALTVSAIAPPACEIRAAQQSLSSVTEEAQILPMGDGSGKYMMKSDGFYCLDVSGARSTTEEVHYFHNFEIDGTVFDGFYYHDKDGKFKAASSHMEHFKNVSVFGSEKRRQRKQKKRKKREELQQKVQKKTRKKRHQKVRQIQQQIQRRMLPQTQKQIQQQMRVRRNWMDFTSLTIWENFPQQLRCVTLII